MRKFFAALLFAASVALPAGAHASAIIQAGQTAILSAIEMSTAAQVVNSGLQLAEDIKQTVDIYNQLQHWIRNEERYMKNLLSVVDVRSFSDFMDWFNRGSYIARESERIYGDMGVSVGGKNYRLSEIDKIPDAIVNEYFDRDWHYLSEEERYRVWTSLGMAPGNYIYMKTWQNRNEEIKKRIVASREMHLDELEEAASRNNSVLSSYSSPSEDIDSNMIAKNAHATQMQIEMALRELTLSLDDLKDYIVTRDQADKILPNGPMPSADWNYDPFKPITDGSAADYWYTF
jgi:hypothetical protein